ncbi:succinate dehydrogenase, cytochrome b556 subunit [Kallotenue papyrolyticum]|uniref:succinate dehydrogenase, cytochrome b556 subunit n=1 Tax=Kallotenue papyrolyticum TaxID=1325125 RepID=UPI00049299F0|nr:succinate dehydrogenase, cytochrome b556 subunit [Kallotenue papyrolyticum]
MNPTYADRYRGKVGMLAWILMRASGLVLTLYALLYVFVLRVARQGPQPFDRLVAQVHTPLWLALHTLLLWLALFHLLNGIRLLALEAGYLRRQREWFWIGLAISLGLTALFAVLAYARLPLAPAT